VEKLPDAGAVVVLIGLVIAPDRRQPGLGDLIACELLGS
jgi:hypothetical protein